MYKSFVRIFVRNLVMDDSDVNGLVMDGLDASNNTISTKWVVYNLGRIYQCVPNFIRPIIMSFPSTTLIISYLEFGQIII